MRISFHGLVLAAAASAALVIGASAPAAQRTKIPFADLGNIRNWEADDPNDLYVQSQNRKWYRITFWSPCHELPFAVAIGFVTDSLGELDKYSSILVDGERCWFRTFEPASGPPSETQPK